MKILLYLNSMAPAGGIERVVSKHICFFVENNEITLLTKDEKESFYKLPDEVVYKTLQIDNTMNMNSKITRIYQSIKQLIKARSALSKFKDDYDLYYVAHIRNLLELYIAGIDLKKVIVTEHGSYFAYNSVYKKLKSFLYKKCKYIVAPTTMDFDVYKSQGYNAKYIPNPLSFFDDRYSKMSEKIVLNIGRLTNDKRQDLLLDIWKDVSVACPDWKLKIVGRGELEPKLANIIKENNLENSVEIIKPTKNVEKLFLESSIFAFTSKFEGFGMVLAEAMAFAVPCISFDIPSGPRDIITDDIDGFLIEDENIKAYTEKLIVLMNDYDKRLQMGKRAKNNITKFLDSEVKKQWDDLINEYNTKKRN